MKHRHKKIQLNRETLRLLENVSLRQVAAATNNSPNSPNVQQCCTDSCRPCMTG